MKVTKEDRQAMRQGAAVLSSYARLIFEGEVERGGALKGKVTDEAVRQEIAEYRELATRLRALAKRRR